MANCCTGPAPTCCKINVIGTSGTVKITYTIGTTINYVVAEVGDPVYIAKESTNVSFTTLSGNATATSTCLSLTNLPAACYLISWESFGLTQEDNLDMVFDRAILGSTLIPITSTPYYHEEASRLLGDWIQALNDSRMIPTAWRVVDSTRGTKHFYLIVKITSAEQFAVRITNPAGAHQLRIIGTLSACLPTGYTAYVPPMILT